MAIKNTFKKTTTEENLNRLDSLSSNSKALWGKMSVSQMLAHINVGYDMCYGNHKHAGGFKKFMFKLLIKNFVVGEKPYQKNGRTAPQFLISEEKDFQKEKLELLEYIKRTSELGENHFEGLENISFGKLSSKEWSNLFQKHIDHHFSQFGV